ncbi:MAG: amino acid permease, partial [Microbacteriaceae bacterium]
MNETSAPARVLGMRAATALGIASMLGAGVFAVWAPATAAAGDWLPVALALAALIAALNALSTMRLAVAHPVAGGAWAYARAEVAPTAGFAAGVLFLVGKTASAAAIASLVGTAVSPEHARPIALAVIAIAAAVTALGVRSTARVAGTVAAIVVATILAVVIAAWVAPPDSDAVPPPIAEAVGAGPDGVLSAAALLFFAFAGYARIATLAAEVRDPRRTLPRAALASIGVVFALS